MNRPAETVGAGGSIASLIAFIAGVHDPATFAYIAAGVGLLPACVTFLVDHGGVRGLFSLLWRGSQAGKGSK